MLGLGPKYLKLEFAKGKEILDIENGKTLADLGFKNDEALTAQKVNMDEEVPKVPLLGPDGKMVPKLLQIFNEWFDMYSDEKGSMTKITCANFIKGCTGEQPRPEDDRVTNLFRLYDVNNDGRIERQEFLTFYDKACRDREGTVRENLKSHLVRNDLKKLSEVEQDQ